MDRRVIEGNGWRHQQYSAMADLVGSVLKFARKIPAGDRRILAVLLAKHGVVSATARELWPEKPSQRSYVQKRIRILRSRVQQDLLTKEFLGSLRILRGQKATGLCTGRQQVRPRRN